MKPLDGHEPAVFSSTVRKPYAPVPPSFFSQLIAVLGAAIGNCSVTVEDFERDGRSLSKKRQGHSWTLNLNHALLQSGPSRKSRLGNQIVLQPSRNLRTCAGSGGKSLTHHRLVVVLPGERRRLTFLRHGIFSARELKLLKLLSLHIIQAQANAARLGAAKRKRINKHPVFDSSVRQVRLTARETEVLGWVAQGKRNCEIGVILNASSRTIQKHVQSILEKLGVETRGAAAAWWFEQRTGVRVS